MNSFLKALVLFASACCFTGCEVIPARLGGNVQPVPGQKVSVLIVLHEQQAHLLRGNETVASADISTGREGYATPVGNFQVIRKDIDHRSGIYGDYVDDHGRIVKANVDVRKDSKPPHSHYLGASMPYFVEFLPGFGMHEGHRPGYPASHGCVRMSSWRARQFYDATKIGTRVTIRR